MTPRKGYVVTEVSLEEIRELYESVRCLEPRAANAPPAITWTPGFRAECESLIRLTGV